MENQENLRVLIGENAEEFTVPTSLLVEKSDFFRAACTKPWLEAKKRTVKLPEMDAEVFGQYLHWVYKGTVAKPAQGDESDFDFQFTQWSSYISLDRRRPIGRL